jgi:UDP-N-acetylglucosamine 2-epimerase (non-hydrolysing)
MNKLLFTFGTRPEIIKLAPLIKAVDSQEDMQSIVCNSAQHRDLSDAHIKELNIKTDYDLNVMASNQSLSDTLSALIGKISKVVEEVEPCAVVAQGDTSTVLASSIVAFFLKRPFFHLEAGLRSGDLYNPFPEEYNRRCVSLVADMHFVPTRFSKENLTDEGINEDKIYVVGNTIIESLKSAIGCSPFLHNENDKNVLVTIHRRENHGENLRFALEAVRELAQRYPDYDFFYPIHPNPNVSKDARNLLKNIRNVLIVDPLEYVDLLRLMQKTTLIITDSGGLQEEATYFRCPVLVLRNSTERIEAVLAGCSTLVGCDRDRIIEQAENILSRGYKNTRVFGVEEIYGVGDTSRQIVKLIRNYFAS